MSDWKTHLKADPIPWLLESNPWTKYRTLVDLLELPADSPQVITMKQELLKNEKIRNLISETSDWFPETYTRHNDPKISHYKLRMLADFGLTVNDPGIKDIVNQATAHVENELFAFKQELPDKSKGFSKPDPENQEWHALPCIWLMY